MLNTTEKISKLTDWQKIDALNTFVVTKANYHLNATIVDQTWAASTDAKIRALTKKALRLPKRTLSTYLHTANQHGGLGLKSLEDARNTTLVARVFSCLSSRDRKVQNIAWAQLTSTVKKRRGINEVSTRDIQDFLNHLPLPQERNSRDVKSIWSTTRKALNHLSCSVSFDGPNIMLNYDGTTTEAGQKETIRKTLRKASDNYRLNELLEAKDQGKSFHLVHKHWSSNHWIHSGAFTTFADYRFAIRARLNLLPTKTVVKRAGKPDIDVTCPRCRRTLAHILNACTPNTGLMRERHNTVLSRLVRAIPKEVGNVFVEQKIPESPGDLRPDVVVLNQSQNTATIVDVTIPFETDELAFEEARNEKLRKYISATENMA